MILWALFSTITAGIVGLIVFIYFLKRGQFDDLEDTKYQIFREEE